MTSEQFTILFNQHHKPLVYLANRMVGEMYGEDIVEDVYMKLYSLDSNYGNGDWTKLLFTMTKRRCLNFIRGRGRELARMNAAPHMKLSDEWADNLIVKAQLIKILVDRIELLSPERRKMFDLIFLHQLSTNEISELTGLSVNTIRVHKMRLVKEFKLFGNNIFTLTQIIK